MHLLPTGRTLADEDWRRRHRILIAVALAHAAGLAVLGLARGLNAGQVALETGVIVAIALVGWLAARPPELSRAVKRLSATAVTIALVTCSTVFVHFMDGGGEAHFHFFIVIVLVGLYEDWLAFGVAVAFVLVHHALLGVLDPHSVFTTDAAQEDPVAWAALRMALVTVAAVAGITVWRMNESVRDEHAEALARIKASEEATRQALWRARESEATTRVALVIATRQEEKTRTALGRARASEARFRSLLETTPGAILGLNGRGEVVLANTAALHLFGAERESLIGTPMSRLALRASRDAVLDQIAAVARHEPPAEPVQIRLRRGDGSLFPAEVRMSLLSESAAETALTAVITDLTERRRAEESLRHLAAVLSSSSEAIVSATAAGVIRSWNPGAERLFGYTAEAAIGQPVFMLVPQEDAEHEHDLIARAASGERVHERVRRVCADGSVVEVDLSFAAAADASGRIDGLTLIGRPVV